MKIELSIKTVFIILAVTIIYLMIGCASVQHAPCDCEQCKSVTVNAPMLEWFGDE